MNESFKIDLLSNEIVSTATLIKVLTLRCFSDKGFEITPEQFIILDTVYKNDQIYQRQIGEFLGKDRANVARLLNVLEKKELIKKTLDSNGRQINRIKLTEKGEMIRNKILPVITKIRKEYLSNINEDDLIKTFEVIKQVKANISKNTKLKI